MLTPLRMRAEDVQLTGPSISLAVTSDPQPFSPCLEAVDPGHLPSLSILNSGIQVTPTQACELTHCTCKPSAHSLAKWPHTLNLLVPFAAVLGSVASDAAVAVKLPTQTVSILWC